MRSHSSALIVFISALCGACAADTQVKAPIDADKIDQEIRASEGAADSARRPTILGEIGTAETEIGAFGSAKRYLGWTFEAQKGQRIILTASDGSGNPEQELDTVLILYKSTASGRPSGSRIAFNDDDGTSLGSRIEITAPESRKYVALARRYDYGSTGNVAVALKLSSSSTGGDCVVGGCSHEICADPGSPTVSACIARPWDGCYQGAICERQDGGHCGWTETPELLQCFVDNDKPCTDSECGPQPLNFHMCPDGSGAGNHCARGESGECGWFADECPHPVDCADVQCGPLPIGVCSSGLTPSYSCRPNDTGVCTWHGSCAGVPPS